MSELLWNKMLVKGAKYWLFITLQKYIISLFSNVYVKIFKPLNILRVQKSGVQTVISGMA